MAQPDLITTPTLRVVAPKPKMTIYYALLMIALVAMLFACLFLYLEIRRYGGFGAVQGRVTSVERGALLFSQADGFAVGRPASRRGDPVWVSHYLVAAGSGCLAPSSRSKSNSAAGSSFTSWNL